MTSLLLSLCQSVSHFRDATFCLEFVMEAPKISGHENALRNLGRNQVLLIPLRNLQERGPGNICMSFLSC